MTSHFKAGLSLTLAVAFILFVAPSQAKDKEKAKDKQKNVQDEGAQIQKLEQQWLEAYVHSNPAVLEQIEEEEFILIDPSGAVVTKSEDIQNVKSGALKWSAANLDQVKIRLYGKTAIVAGVAHITGSFHGQDITGKYRFTDVFIRKKKEWHAVSSQVTTISAK